MADGKGDSNGDGWQRRKRDGCSDGRWWLQQQWPTGTAMAIGYGDVDSNGDWVSDGNGDGSGDCNGNGHTVGNNDKGRVASLCASNVQCCGRGNTFPPPLWTQQKCIHQRWIMGVTLLKVFAPFQGGGFLTTHHGLYFVYFLQLLFSLLNNPMFTPCIIQVLKNTVSPLALYLLHWRSTPAPIALFVKVSPGRACNDYNVTFLCWC